MKSYLMYTKSLEVLDERIVWYGNIHLLGYGQETETIMRIDRIEVAEELRQTLKQEKQ